LKWLNAKSVYPRYSLDMNKELFFQLLQENGFPEPVEVRQIPDGHLDRHEHPFEVMALVVDGSIQIVIDGISKIYSSGDIFHLSLNQSHAESYGPEGVTYLASRKY
jgi:quercetin dioxygenase-like cupin family protein